MSKRVRLYQAAMFGLALPAAAYALPQNYTDTHLDQVGSANLARDIWGATIDDDGTNLYFTINLNPGANLAGNNFDYGIGLTTGLPGAGGDVSTNPATHGNAYNRNLSINSSLGGMLGFVGLFGVGGSGSGTSPFTGYGYNDFNWNSSNSTWTQRTNLNSTTAGVPFNKQVGGSNQSSITVAVPIADFTGSLSLTPGTNLAFDIYSTGTGAGQTAYDSLADSAPTNGTGNGSGSAIAQYDGTVLLNYTVQGTGPLSLVWNNNSAGGVADGATWDSAQNGIAGGAVNQNWLDSTTPTFFFANNAVTFNDSNNGHYAVTLNSTVKPAAVMFNNSAGNYTISGSGTITGTAGLTKLGTGSLSISTTNNFTGGVNISGGTLILLNTNALGFNARLTAGQIPGATVINPGGTLDLNARLLTEPVTLNGGTLTNSNTTTGALTLGIKGVSFTGSTGPFSADAAINLTGGGGTGAVAKVVLSLSQASLSLANKGSGYSSIPAVTISGGGGSSATATATLGLSNSSIGITNAGAGYAAAPTVAITGGGGTGATATATITAGAVTGITIVNPGTGYTTAPTIAFTGGSTVPASASGNATNFIVNGLTLGNAGLNFSSLPTIAFSGGGSGTGAAATVVDNKFNLLGIQQTVAGSGYGSAPTATFTAATGSITTGTVVAATFTLAADSSVGGIGNINITGPITGVGGLNKIGADTLTITGNSNYSGNTIITAGSLATGAANSLSPNSAFNVSSGVLDASGFNNSIASLTVGSGGTLNLGVGSVLTSTGDVSLGGSLNVIGTPSGSLVELMAYNSEAGTFATAPTIPGYSLVYNPTQLDLVSSGPANLTWNNLGGTGSGTTWDTTSQNWNNGTGATAYSNTSGSPTAGDNVTFSDTNNGNYNVLIPNVVTPTSTTVNNSIAGYTFTGSGGIGGSGSLTKLGTSSLTLATSNNYTGGTNVSGGSVILAVAGALPAGTNLTIGSGASVVANNLGTAVALTVGSLSVAGKLDLNNNALIVHNSSIGAVTTLVTSGFNGGTWNGATGIVSSTATADATHLTGLGAIQNSTDGTTSGAVLHSTFEGAAASNTDVLVKFTYYGDANLDGMVDGSDYSRIDSSFLSEQTGPSVSGWFNGDFNYDGVVNGSDYTLIDNAFNSQGVQLTSEIAMPTAEIAGGTTAVPEPATLGLVGFAAISLLGRRRRKV